MAVTKKRRVASGSPESSDSNSEQGAAENQNIIEVDFEARAPDDSDFPGIKSLMHQLFLKSHINISDLTNLLIQQNSITSVIKQCNFDEMDADEPKDSDDEDEDFNYGVFSVVNLTVNKDKESIKQIQSFILNHCREANSKEYSSLQKILEDNEKHVGLIINERFLNIPPKISLPIYEQLSNDLEEGMTQKQPFNFSYFIIISKLLTFGEGNSGTTIYTNAEEELFEEDAQLTFEFSVSEEQDTGLSGKWSEDDAEGQPKRKIMLFPASSLDIMRTKLKNEFLPEENK